MSYDPLGTLKTDAFDSGLTVWVDDVTFVSPDTIDPPEETAVHAVPAPRRATSIDPR